MIRLLSALVLLLLVSHAAHAQPVGQGFMPFGLGAPNPLDATNAQQAYAGTGGPVMMNMELFATVYTAVNTPMENAVNGVVQSLVAYIQPQFRNFVLLAVLLGMLAALVADHADSHAAAMALVRIAARGSALSATLGTAANFSDWVIAPFLAFPKQVTAALLGATGQAAINGGAPFDAVFTHVLKADFNALSAIGFTSIEGLVGGFGIIVSAAFSGVLIGFMFFTWLVAYVLFYLIIATSPLFVATLMFPFTRQFFQGWLATAVTSSMVVILIALMLSLLLKVQQQLVDLIMNAPANANKWGMLGNAIAMFALSALGAMAAWKIDHKAEGLGRGASQQTMHYVGAIGSAAGSAGSWASNWINSHMGGNTPIQQGAPAFVGSGGGGAAAPAGRSLSGNSPFGRRP